MRHLTTVLMFAAMAAGALAQDPNPNGNRMNDALLRRAQPRESTARGPALPDPFANRMNVVYGTTGDASLSGGPNPYGNRMNFGWPKTKAPPRAIEPEPAPPEPTP